MLYFYKFVAICYIFYMELMFELTTPNSLIVIIVASRYGFETKSPSIVKLIPFFVSGAVINNDVINWLDKFPGILTSPPTILPLILTGGFPSFELHFAPILDNASSNGFIGLF